MKPSNYEILSKFVISDSDLDGFYEKLRNLAYKTGGLRVTHETDRKHFQSVWDKGVLRLDKGIYCFIGWHTKPKWIHGDGIIVHATIPFDKLNQRYIVPDDRFDSEADLLEQFPNLIGAEIGMDLDSVPVSWIDNILDNNGKSLINRKLRR